MSTPTERLYQRRWERTAAFALWTAIIALTVASLALAGLIILAATR